jgi:hypothetical protein
MNRSIVMIISYIRSEIKIPSIIFSGYEYYYLKYFILKNKHTASANIDKMIDIY